MVAAGIWSPATMKPDARKAYYSRLLDLDVAKAQIKKALGPEIYDSCGDGIYDAITADGWEKTYKFYYGQRTFQNTKWSNLTGMRYGTEKAREWREKVEGNAGDVNALKAAHAAAATLLEKAIAWEAVKDSVRGPLKEIAARHEKDLLDHTAVKKQIDDLHEECAAIEKELAKLKVQKYDVVLSCPECGTSLNNMGGKLVVDTVTDDERFEWKQLIERKTLEHGAAMEKVGLASGQEIDLWKAVTTSLAAKEQLQKLDSTEKCDTTAAEAREALAASKTALDDVEKVKHALTALDSIAELEAILNALSPDGIRKTIIGKKLNVINKRLMEIGGDLGTVSLDSEMTVYFNQRPYWLCAGSEKWRAELFLAIHAAEIDGSKVIVMDEAEKLSKKNREKLYKKLHKDFPQFTFFIGITSSKKGNMPDSKALRMKEIWIEE